MGEQKQHQQMKRQVGLLGGVSLGLGSMMGTGVFAAIPILVGVDSLGLLAYAIPLAGLLAFLNGLSSARLAAAHPVAGGTYEYAYRLVHPWAGFSAGWLFLAAKSLSAASAAMALDAGLHHYFPGLDSFTHLAPMLVVVVTILVLAGIRKSLWVNTLLVGIGLVAIFLFLTAVPEEGSELKEVAVSKGLGLFELTALAFVAYTGYGRIATLGEEIVDPKRNIMRALLIATGICTLIYWLVYRKLAWWGLEGSEQSLSTVRGLSPDLEGLLLVGAFAAILGSLLNLILGLSRMLLAFARRDDMPGFLAKLSAGGEPSAAIVVIGLLITALSLIGDLYFAWSLSAFTVLLYYGLAHLSAWRLGGAWYWRLVAALGLIGCVGMGFCLQRELIYIGLGVLAVGFAWRVLWRGLFVSKVS